MFRVICITALSFLISGCPAMLYGNLKNESETELTVSPPNIPENAWIIQPGERIKVVWYQECIIIREGSITKYFAGWPIPDNTVTPSIFSSSLKAMYKKGTLYFESKDGKLVEIPEVEKCGTV